MALIPDLLTWLSEKESVGCCQTQDALLNRVKKAAAGIVEKKQADPLPH